ncbi:MAG: formylglycine-generating enzyme family protein [Bacteroidota bacterium]
MRILILTFLFSSLAWLAEAQNHDTLKSFDQNGIATLQRDSIATLDKMVFVQGGTFQMGSNEGDSDEKPMHQITLSDFYLGQKEVTKGEFADFVTATKHKTTAEKVGSTYGLKDGEPGLNDGLNWRDMGFSQSDDHPIIGVSWYDAVAYCNWKSEQDSLQPVYTIGEENVTANWNANGYRLPTEAEWEYAARSRGGSNIWAGTSSEDSLTAYGNYLSEKDSYSHTAPVGSFAPNEIGLSDMSGNVWEWCWDWERTYSPSSQTNPRGEDTGTHRVIRGGSWYLSPDYLRCSLRMAIGPTETIFDLGFRLARAAR